MDGPFRLKDIALSVPAVIGSEGARIVPMKFSQEVNDKFCEALNHIDKMNDMADELLESRGKRK